MRKIFCVTYLKTKSFKTMQAKFLRKFKFKNYPQKKNWVHKFQAMGSVNNLNEKRENHRSVRKLKARCPEIVDAVRNSLGRSPKKSFWRRSLELGLSRAMLDKVNQFLSLSSGLTFLKWYDWFLRFRCKMTCNLTYINGCSYFVTPCITVMIIIFPPCEFFFTPDYCFIIEV